MKKKVCWSIMVTIICMILTAYPSFAQEVHISLETSISVKDAGITYRICIINKQNELWAYYGKDKRELLDTDVAQVAKGGDIYLKTDGTLWEWTLIHKA